jgi:hypothetical protein
MRGSAIAVLVTLSALMGLPSASAAQAPGLVPGRDCQTLVSCNFRKNGSYRGCLSSYSCRVCKLVAAPCQVKGGERTCRAMRCGWG